MVYPRACGGTGVHVTAASSRDMSVYPRACGGTEASGRARDERGSGRSIPAPAGEPAVGLPESCPIATVYPRACGGTGCTSHPPQPEWYEGLSPRLRGNRAGVPSGITRASGLSPRLRGNRSRSTVAVNIIREGLSPRLRGNLRIGRRTTVWKWVYPRACGGTGYGLEDLLSCLGRVYPRACGGTR